MLAKGSYLSKILAWFHGLCNWLQTVHIWPKFSLGFMDYATGCKRYTWPIFLLGFMDYASGCKMFIFGPYSYLLSRAMLVVANGSHLAQILTCFRLLVYFLRYMNTSSQLVCTHNWSEGGRRLRTAGVE